MGCYFYITISLCVFVDTAFLLCRAECDTRNQLNYFKAQNTMWFKINLTLFKSHISQIKQGMTYFEFYQHFPNL